MQKAKRVMEGKEIEGRKLRVRSAKDSDKKKSNETTRENRGDERAQEQKLVITREDTTKHLVQAFHDFLGRQLEGNHSNVEFRGEIESARTALAFAYSLPKDDSLKVSRKIEDTFYRWFLFALISLFFIKIISREAREELSKVSRKREGSGDEKQEVDGSLKRSKSDLVATEKVATETSSIKMEKDLDLVKDDVWQRDEIGVDEVASEEVDNDDLDHALAEADLGFTLDG